MMASVKSLLTVLAFSLIFLSLHAQSIEDQMDPVLQAWVSTSGPGVTALISKEGKTVYQKSIGQASSHDVL